MKKLLFLIISTIIFSENIDIIFWNTLHLGWNNSKDYKVMTNTLKNYDLIGLVEVMNESGIKKLIFELENVTNKDYDYFISPQKYGRTNYKEYYAYIWDSNKIKLIKDLGEFEDIHDIFEREPYAVIFKGKYIDFTYVLYHAVFGKRKDDRRSEIKNLDLMYSYFQFVNFKENDIIIGGDFNIHASDYSFTILGIDGIKYLIEENIKTTSANSYDNFLISDFTKEEYKEVGILNNFKLNKTISDHYPIFIRLEDIKDDD